MSDPSPPTVLPPAQALQLAVAQARSLSTTLACPACGATLRRERPWRSRSCEHSFCAHCAERARGSAALCPVPGCSMPVRPADVVEDVGSRQLVEAVDALADWADHVTAGWHSDANPAPAMTHRSASPSTPARPLPSPSVSSPPMASPPIPSPPAPLPHMSSSHAPPPHPSSMRAHPHSQSSSASIAPSPRLLHTPSSVIAQTPPPIVVDTPPVAPRTPPPIDSQPATICSARIATSSIAPDPLPESANSQSAARCLPLPQASRARRDWLNSDIPLARCSPLQHAQTPAASTVATVQTSAFHMGNGRSDARQSDIAQANNSVNNAASDPLSSSVAREVVSQTSSFMNESIPLGGGAPARAL